MVALRESTCPGCGLRMPARASAVYEGYYNTAPECWLVYTEVLASDYGDMILYGQVHQLTVDTYAVQHAGGPHPDKSICIHLCGLQLVLERGLRQPSVPPLLKRLADVVKPWPHFPPPAQRGMLTVADVALADSVEKQISKVREWAGEVWQAWSHCHAEVSALVARHLRLD